ncbi:CoA transferase [Variovorax defluvii]|uniref:CoA transferase n=1 Tax=Variovorax defluvii TaxID=913761 RepID=A0ABP8HU56_9BURK
MRDSLSGIRVLDFSHVVAGPVCGMLLGDMGADVCKIEPLDGELGRTIGPPWQNGESVVALSVNRSKRGLAVDLRHEAGRAAVRRMALQADILVESFRPGVMRKFGLDAPSLQGANPRLVYCSISAYGQSGPGRDKPGVDGVIQAVAGLMATLGEENGSPAKVGIPIADMATGYLATVATLSALHKARETGRGQHLDMSLFNATVMLQHLGMAFHFATGLEPAKLGSAAPYAAPNEAFPTADGWIMVAAYQPARWNRLCELLGLEDLSRDARFADNEARVGNRTALHAVLDPVFQRFSTRHWLDRLSAGDILCAPIASYAQVRASAEYQAGGIEIETEHPVAGTVRMPGLAFGDATTLPYRAAPTPGQHSAEILAEYGIDAEDIRALQACGAIRGPSINP